MRTRTALGWTAGAAGVAAGTYAGCVAASWLAYGRPTSPATGEDDGLLDRFMPAYEVVERHHIAVAAPADVTFSAACEQELTQVPLVRAIFRARELVLGSTPDAVVRPSGILAFTTSIGWRVLAEVPGREVVVGAVTQPWLANPEFTSLPPDRFAAFDEPGYVKIAWTLRADPIGTNRSIFRTETRVQTTDAAARRKFRWYWARFSPGIILIRWLSLGPIRMEAERRVREVSSRRR